MEECWRVRPPLYRTHADRAVTCYLYNDNPQVSGREMAEWLAE
jgi:hypothetical protein